MGQAGVGSCYTVQARINRTLSNKMNGRDTAEHNPNVAADRNGGRREGVKSYFFKWN